MRVKLSFLLDKDFENKTIPWLKRMAGQNAYSIHTEHLYQINPQRHMGASNPLHYLKNIKIKNKKTSKKLKALFVILHSIITHFFIFYHIIYFIIFFLKKKKYQII